MENKRKYFVLILFLLLALMIFAFANPIVEETTDFKDSGNDETEKVEKPEVIVDTNTNDDNYIPVVRPVQKEDTTEETEDEIDTTYEDALTAVEYAEATYKAEDVEKAKELINKVTDTTKKGELEERLAEVEAGIEVMELIEKLEYQIAKATKKEDLNDAKDYRDENEVAKKLEALTNEDVKEALQKRLDKVNKYLDDNNAPVINIKDKDIYTEDVEIKVEDENDVIITLTKNNEEQEDTSKTSKDGIYTLTVVDKAFNEITVTFTVDATAPEFTGLEDGKFYEEFTVEVEDLTNTTIEISKDNGEKTPIENGTKVDVEGTYTLTATDEAGNTTTITVMVDRNAPTIDRTDDIEYTTQDQTVTVKDTFLTEVTVEGNEQAGTYTEFTEGTIEFTFTVEGTYTITAKDEIGNVTKETFTIDKTAPVINGFKDCKYYYNTSIKPELVEENLESYTLNGEEYDGKEIKEDGVYTLVATDKAGFKTEIKFVIDKTAPSVTGLEEGKFYNDSVTPVIEDENLAYVTVDGLPFIPGQSVVLYGTHTLVATDKAGNTTTVEFTIDNIAPKVLLLDRLQYVSGKYLPIKPVILEQHIDTIVVKKNGQVIEYVQGQELKGDADYEITVTDKAGNTTTVEFTMDSVSPTALVKPVQLGVVTELDLNNMEVVDNLDDLSLSLLDKDLLLSEEVDYILLKKEKSITVLGINIPIYKYTEIPSNEVISEEGDYILVVYDKAYNLSAVKFVVDRSAPVIDGLEEGKEFYNTELTLTVKEANPYALLGQDATVTVSKKGNLLPSTYAANEEFTLTEDGQYTIKAKDIAGNEVEVTFTIDKTAPVINTNVNGEVEKSDTALNVVGTVIEENLTTESTEVKPSVYVKNEDNYELVEEAASTIDVSVNGVEYKLVYTYTDKAGNTTTKEVYTKVVTIKHEVRFNKETYTSEYTGEKHSVPTDAYYVEIKDGVETVLTDTTIEYTADVDMINVGDYTITAKVGNITTTAIYTITKAELEVTFGENVEVKFANGKDASDYVEIKYYAWGTKKVQQVIGEGKWWEYTIDIDLPVIVEVTEIPVGKEYYVTVAAANENVKIKGAVDIDLSDLGLDIRLNGKLNKYN